MNLFDLFISSKIAKKALLILFFSSSIQLTNAQLEGLWLAEKVEAGNKNVTPTARWAQFSSDGSISSGNGWLKHTVGRWKFDPLTKQLVLINENAPIDETGPFTVSRLEKESMTWERMEESEKVKVSWKKIDSLPAAPADLVIGLWDVEKIVQHGKEVTQQLDPENKMNVFMRWDRIFSFKDRQNGLSSGNWLMSAKQPILELIGDENREKWRVIFENDKMVWESLTEESNTTLTFTRMSRFPAE